MTNNIETKAAAISTELVDKVKTDVTEVVKNLPSTETKLHTEAQTILAAIKNGCAHLLNIEHIAAVWLQNARKKVEGK